jgi:thioredoxin reductase
LANNAFEEALFLTHITKRLERVFVEDRVTCESRNGKWEYDGIFVFIGLSPNSSLVKAAGDVRAGSTKQAASAAGEGQLLH